MAKEEENYFMICLLFLEVATPLLTQFLDKCLAKRFQSLESFINFNHHKLYHLCFTNAKCCKCTNDIMHVPRRALTTDQLNLIFGCCNPSTARCDQFCCADAKPGISTKNLDASFINTLLLNFFPDVFWDFLRTLDFGSFLNSNRHTIFHLCENTNCCMCLQGNALSPQKRKLDQRSIKKIYDLNGLVCRTCSNTTNRMTFLPCTMTAKQNIVKERLNEKEISIFQQCFSPIRIAITTIIDIRNTNICHVTNASMSDDKFASVKDQLERAILELADACGSRQLTETLIQHTVERRFDKELLQRSLIVLQDHCNRETSLERIVLNLTDTVTSRLDGQNKAIENVDDKVVQSEINAEFYNLYIDKPLIFIFRQILKLNKKDIKYLCEEGAIFEIMTAEYPLSTVFMSTLEARWIRHNKVKEKNSRFRLKMAKDTDEGNHLFHIISADLPKYYLTMGYRGWWVRAKLCDGQLIDKDAIWDIRCLKTLDMRSTNRLPNYILVHKNSNSFVCVDRFGRLYGSCGNIDTSKMFNFKRVQ